MLLRLKNWASFNGLPCKPNSFLNALNDTGIPCDHVKNVNVTVNWQWPRCFSEEKTVTVIPHNEMH